MRAIKHQDIAHDSPSSDRSGEARVASFQEADTLSVLSGKQPRVARLKPDASLDHKASMICNTAVNLCEAFPWTGSPIKDVLRGTCGRGPLFFGLTRLAECFLDRMEAAAIAQ